MVFGGARYRDSWVSLWFSCLLLHGAEILYVPNAAHVGSIIGAGTVFSSQIILRGHRRSASSTPLDLPLPILGGMPRTLRSASALAASWQCQRCDYTNDSAKNKRCCFLCRAWREGIAPMSSAGIAIVDAHGGGGASFCSNKNDAPNNASPRKVGSPKKRGEKRKSPSSGLGGMVLHPLPPPSPPPLRPTRSITPRPPLQCRGICGGFFAPALTFAAKSMEHTANQPR
jgi:hypothetical protein